MNNVNGEFFASKEHIATILSITTLVVAATTSVIMAVVL